MIDDAELILVAAYHRAGATVWRSKLVSGISERERQAVETCKQVSIIDKTTNLKFIFKVQLDILTNSIWFEWSRSEPNDGALNPPEHLY